MSVVELELSSVAGTVVLVFVTGACYIKIFSKYSWIETVWRTLIYLPGVECCTFSCYGMLFAPLPLKTEIFVSARRALMKA